MDEFLRRQREAGLRIARVYARMVDEQNGVTLASANAVAQLDPTMSFSVRERTAAEAVASTHARFETATREATTELMAAVAEMSENWDANADSQPWDIQTVDAALNAWMKTGEAAANAPLSTEELKRSIRDFAALGPNCAAAVRGTLTALDGFTAASEEVATLAEDYLTKLDEIRRRLN